MTAARHGLPALCFAALLGLATTVAAHAQNLQQQSFSRWKITTDCATAAAKKFPDHTPDSNAKREAARLECLRNNQIPVPAAAAPQPR